MYQVLARKYRPRNFNELVGQNHVSRALTSALERGRLHHAYLFTGTRGVGKTTIARILAKCLNCETGVTSTPCEVCATCRAVNEGRFIDLIEIDAASRTKVEDTRELLDNVPYAPTQGRFKVYLIDEVHMLSTHSFNALLKTLEEPPEHVKFLFATTDPQKLPITVISRCLQFTLRPLAVDEITTHLTDILAKEQIQSEQDAIWQIAEAAQGSLRDALSLTDQAIAYGQGQVQHRDVKEMLGLIDRSIIYDLILAIHQNQQAHVSQLLLQFRQQALDVSLVLDQLITTLHELALLQYLPDLALKYSNEINQKITQLSQRISAQDLQLYYQVACKGRAELQLAVTQEQGFEMCVLRLLAFRPLQANERTVNHVNTAQPVTDIEQQNAIVSVESTAQVAEDVVYVDEDITQTHEAFESAEISMSENVIAEVIPTDDIQQQVATDSQSSDLLTFDLAQTDGLLGLVSEPTQAPVVQAFAKQGVLQSDAMDFPLDDVQNDQQVAGVPGQETVASQEFSLSSTADIAQHVDINHVYVEDHTQPENSINQDMFGHDDPVQDQPLQNDIFQHDVQPHHAIPDHAFANESVQHDLQNTEIQVGTQAPVAQHILEQAPQDQRMPQDILKLDEQDLTGDWTLYKWEYWFRNSHLSPAIQELAQHGQMSGQIDGQSILHLPPEYESLFHAVAPVLEQALQTQWPNTRLQIKYAMLKGQTPQHLNQQRKADAYQRALDLLQQDKNVASLMQAFDAQLEHVQLK